jgi:hypothetical protein
MIPIKKLNQMMDDPRLANGVFTRLFTQEILMNTGQVTTKSIQVDKAYDYFLTYISAEAIYSDGTVIDDPKYLPRIGITDQQEGEKLVPDDIRKRDDVKNLVSFQELSPGTLGNPLTNIFPMFRYIPNNGVFDVVYTRENINPAPGKDTLKVYATFLGINIQNPNVEI